MTKTKVFGIGFHKTGTTSLGKSLEILGYSVCGPVGVMKAHIGDKVHDIAFRYTDQFDAFQDNPWPLLYKDLDAKYPGSKFILTVRSMESWIGSLVSHFGIQDTPMREWIYGVGHPEGHEDIYIDRHRRHVAEVREYFKDRPNDLLVFNLTGGETWERLCPFLGKPVPDLPYPRANKKHDRGKLLAKLASHTRRLVRRTRRLSENSDRSEGKSD